MSVKSDPKQGCLECRILQEENGRLRMEIDRLNGLLTEMNHTVDDEIQNTDTQKRESIDGSGYSDACLQ